MRLLGERVALVPVPHEVAVSAVRGEGLGPALDAMRLTAGGGWPHPDTVDALRPLVERDVPVSLHGTFLITVDSQVVGECGWLGGPDAAGSAEIGFGVAGSARGRGLATEAVGILTAWAEQQPGVARLTADVLIGNAPSRRLLERLGFEPAGPNGRYVTYERPAARLDRSRNSG